MILFRNSGKIKLNRPTARGIFVFKPWANSGRGKQLSDRVIIGWGGHRTHSIKKAKELVRIDDEFDTLDKDTGD